MWPNTTKGTSCLHLNKLRFLHYLTKDFWSNRGFNKISNGTELLKIEVILLEIQCLPSLNFFSFPLYFALYFVQYLSINLADKMYLLLYWVTLCTIVCMNVAYFTILLWQWIWCGINDERKAHITHGIAWQLTTNDQQETIFL